MPYSGRPLKLPSHRPSSSMCPDKIYITVRAFFAAHTRSLQEDSVIRHDVRLVVIMN